MVKYVSECNTPSTLLFYTKILNLAINLFVNVLFAKKTPLAYLSDNTIGTMSMQLLICVASIEIIENVIKQTCFIYKYVTNM